MVKYIKKITGFLCCLVFCAAITAGIPQMARAAEIAIDATNFPDENFRDYVSSKFDTDSNNVLSEEEIANVKQIDVRVGMDVGSKKITSLKGIEHFMALTSLDCYNNALETLDVSKNTALTDLRCDCNQLTALDVSNNTALTHLDCSNNQLTALDVSKNTALTSLVCSGNQLTALDVSNNTALTSLSCSNNQLTALDVSKNTALTSLVCSGNQLTALDVSKNTALTSLVCYYNQLTVLDVSKNTALTSLVCYGNQLTVLDVSKNTALTELRCDYNQLTALDVSKNTALTDLRCDCNQLTALDVSKNTVLKIFMCSNNQLTVLDVSKNRTLKGLDCSCNQLTVLDVSKNTALTELVCDCNQLTALDVSKNIALTELNCINSQLTELKLNSRARLTLYKGNLHGNVNLSDLQNITETATNNNPFTISWLRVIDITKPATYKVDGKNFTIIYVDKVVMPSVSPTSDVHIFSDYYYSNPVTGPAVVIYGNGINKKIDGKRVNNKALTLYTDILASYKHTPNSNGTVKSSVGKVIVAVTKINEKPAINNKNKVTDTSASKIAKATIKNGQITVTAVGKEGGLVYLWVIDTGTKGVSACCPIDVKLAPNKLEVQSTTGTKLTNTKIENGRTLFVHIAGLAGSVKTEDCTYTPTVDSKFQQYIQIVPKDTTGQDFMITAKGLKDDKDTKAAITFTCDQNGKKVKFSLTITK